MANLSRPFSTAIPEAAKCAVRGPPLRDKLFYTLHNPVTLHVVCQDMLLRSR